MSTKTSRKILSRALLAGLATLTAVSASAADGAGPVLMVIANQDFHYAEYSRVRSSIEAAGLEVVVAAATTRSAKPQD
ncbi:MAG: hypothetical protein KDI37_03230, partial [Xanthomonadales bacterium]|nr:hypothetical protein [Xanthomonadales bacterium]